MKVPSKPYARPSGAPTDEVIGNWQLTACPVPCSNVPGDGHGSGRFVSTPFPSARGSPPARAMRGSCRLPADAEPADDGPVPLDVVVPDVVEEPAATTDQPHEASTRVVVALMDLQVLGEVRDAFGEERDLDLGRPGVGLVNAVFGNRRKLVWHVWGERPRRF